MSPNKSQVKSRWRRLLLYVGGAGLLLVLFLGGLAAWFFHVAKAALPDLDGQPAVTGLLQPLTVSRDDHGVPTITAGSLTDLFFAQGYVTAQDRLWQMDMTRRFASGEIAELLGADWIKHDREQRILRLRATAEQNAQELSPRDRVFLEAYSSGVNAYITAHEKNLPLEFHLLRYSPRPWTPADTLVIYANMVKELNHWEARQALAREKVTAKVGPDLAADLYVNSSPRDHPPGQDNSSGDQQDVLNEPASSQKAAPFAFGSAAANFASPDSQPEFGSNDWVISGAHTVSGKPLLANDPHLGHQMPALWYEAHLRCGSFDVAGVSLPGAPGIVLGHNQRIAWGFTNTGATVEDIFAETFNAAGQYQTPTGWKEPQRISEIIHVHGKPDVHLEVLITRHGPIVSELFPGEKRTLALEWMLYSPNALQLSLFDLDSAQNWQQFRQALAKWVGPGQNVVYADVDGHIAYQAMGRVPIRAAGDGGLPAAGNDNAYEWIGFIPFDKMPRVFDPPSGILATANGRITPNGYPYSISASWEPPYRTERIYHVLQSENKLRPQDMLALQTDIYSAFDHLCAERFVYALDHVQELSPRARQARDLMRGWDGKMEMNSAAAAVEVQARRELYRLLLEPKLGLTLASRKESGGTEREPASSGLSWRTYDWFMWPVWMENVLSQQPKRWLPAEFRNYDELLARAVENAVSSSGTAGDLSTWKWGSLNQVEIQHPILGTIPILQRWTGPGTNPQSGDSYTVKAVGENWGPSERMTVDLSNLDNSTLNIVTGQSGNFLGPYYMDQWQAWYEGTSFTFPSSGQAVQSGRAHLLVLQPAASP